MLRVALLSWLVPLAGIGIGVFNVATGANRFSIAMGGFGVGVGLSLFVFLRIMRSVLVLQRQQIEERNRSRRP